MKINSVKSCLSILFLGAFILYFLVGLGTQMSCVYDLSIHKNIKREAFYFKNTTLYDDYYNRPIDTSMYKMLDSFFDSTQIHNKDEWARLYAMGYLKGDTSKKAMYFIQQVPIRNVPKNLPIPDGIINVIVDYNQDIEYNNAIYNVKLDYDIEAEKQEIYRKLLRNFLLYNLPLVALYYFRKFYYLYLHE